MARHERFFDDAAPVSARAARGRTSYHAGLAAEDVVERHFVATGHRVLARRWRGKRGEVDLILEIGALVVLVEVKASRDFDAALSHLSQAQVQRLYTTADEYLGTRPDGSLTDVRFDVALVNRSGQVRVLENAFAGAF